MKILAMLLASGCLLASPAFAGGNYGGGESGHGEYGDYNKPDRGGDPDASATSSSDASANANAKASADASSKSNNNNTNDNSSGASISNDVPRQTPSAFAPGLTNGVFTCNGSISAGGSGPMFGFALGATRRDKNCDRRADAAALAALGKIATACRLMMQAPGVANAMAASGETCDVQVAIALPPPLALPEAAVPKIKPHHRHHTTLGCPSGSAMKCTPAK